MSETTRILIVEDLPTDAVLAEREVRQVLPHSEFLRVETREGFLAALVSFRPGLILSDFKLPQFDGLTALRLAQERAPDTPFIILTGSMNEDTAVECMKAGAWDYVIKEHVKRLGHAVLRVLEQKRSRDERKRAEEELRWSEARYRTLFESSRDAIMALFPPDWRFTSANASTLEMFGAKDEKEFTSLGPWKVSPERQPDGQLSAEKAKRMIETAMAKGSHFFEWTHQRIGGDSFPATVLLTRVEFGGQMGLQATVRDITDQKRAEAERERLSMAIEQAAEVVVITDAKALIQYVNPAFTAITGYTRDEALGQNPRILKSGEQDEAFYSELWRTISSGKPWQGRFVNRKKDGTHYTEDATISPVSDAAGRIVNYVAVKKDITEEIQLEARFQQAQKMEAVGRLAGGVAHDFNNLLTGIMGYAQLLLKKAEPGSSVHQDLSQVVALADRAANLTRQLLAFSRKQPLAPVVLDLNDVVGNATKMLQRVIGEDIDLLFSPGKALGRVRADPGQIEQVLMNLAVNARDAMPKGGALTIETSNVTLSEEYAAHHADVTPGPHVMMAVTDTGCGMDEKTKEHLFDPFFTTKEPGKGTGLGLSTVYGIVKQHGGSIWVYSEAAKGTTFKIYLPRVDAEVPARAGSQEDQGPPEGSETVLVVEDEAAVRDVALRALQQMGYTVLCADDPDEAESLFEAHKDRISLLVTDVILPQRNGRRLYEGLAAKRPSLKVLYMSGYADDAIVHQGILDAGVAFMQKPFAIETVARKVRQVLDS